VVLLDLRHASGGTVDQVTAAAGRFLPQGAILRSQRRGEQASTHAPLDAEPREDFRRFLDDAAPDRGGSAWKLPLVLLTDRETGGAAELFAAALQDYGRALIVGPGTTAEQGVDTATLPVISASSTGAQKNMGGLTVARGLFYRPSGNSLLDRGVAADVLLPSLRDQLGQADPFSSLLAAGQADRLEYQRLDYGVNQAVRDRLAARSAKRRSESAEHESLNQQLSSLLAADLGRIPLDDAAFQRWQAAQDALPAAGALANEAHDLQLREAVEISVDYVSSFEQSRGQRCYAERRWAQAARHFIESTQNDPLNAEAFNHFAWLLAACPAAEHRSGARAVEYASRACELSQNRQWAYLLTLALAHAEKKDFAAAIERLDQALALAPEGDRVKYLPLKAQFEKRRPYVAP
jgi:hypothetical protein